MEKNLEDSIGSGANFPIVLDFLRDDNGEVMLNSEGKPLKGWHIVKGDIKLIEQNLQNIIFTMVGQRIRQEEFGCRIHEVLEEPNNRVVQHLSSKFVSEAILQWEPRLAQIKVKANSVYNQLSIEINYELKSSPEIGNNILTLSYNL